MRLSQYQHTFTVITTHLYNISIQVLLYYSGSRQLYYSSTSTSTSEVLLLQLYEVYSRPRASVDTIDRLVAHKAFEYKSTCDCELYTMYTTMSV